MLSASKIMLTLKAYGLSRYAIKGQYDRKWIDETRDKKLRKLVRYCYENVKYYREAFDQANVTPANIHSAKDIYKLPFLTKKELQGRLWDFLPKQIGPCRISRTSGSTGVPVCIFSDENSRMHNAAAVIKYRKAVGIALFGSTIITPLKNESEKTKKPVWTYFHGLHKTCYVNPYLESQEHFDYASKLFKRKADAALIGITPAIVKLAYQINDGKVSGFRPKAIITGGQSLSDKDRDVIEGVFSTKVTDVYACSEGGEVAWQCRASDYYHINEDNCIVEILKDDKSAKSGEVGEVVITNLNRFAMPILRYKVGDLAIATDHKCICGRKLAMLEKIVGRDGQNIICPNGKVLLWNQLKGFMNISQVRQFQIIQNSDGSLTVKYVPAEDADIREISRLIKSRFEPVVGNSVKFNIEEVTSIKPAKSGKLKLVVSNYRR